MRFVFLLILAASLAHGEWFRNPVAFRKVEAGFELAEQGSGFAMRDELPLSQDVSVEGDFTIMPSEPADNWYVAAVAVVENHRNFWHLGVVKPPKEHNFNYTFELCEMLDGKWLAQSSLKLEFTERDPAVKIAVGSRWNLKIALEAKGITGEVKDVHGKIVFRQRYSFTSRAVTVGRPALHSTGLSGVFADLKFSTGAAVVVDEQTQSFPPYNSDNYIKEIKAKATGYFYVKQFADGRWWAIDPLGRGVVVLGVDHTTFWGHWCETLGYQPYGRENEKKYPDPKVWEEETLTRLKSWGFTMLGAGSQESLRRRGLFHCVNLGIGTQLATFEEEYYITPNEKRPCSSFPNVFHPEFESYCRYVARTKCRPNLNDPWMFGYFSDNELAWWGRGKQATGLFDAAMKLGASHTAKQALVNFVKQRAGNGIEQFNAVWHTKCGSFDDVLKLTQLPAESETQIEIKHDFLKLAAERYFSTTSKVIREVDPNHMMLGARFAGTGGADPAVWEITGKYCDVVTFNCYPKADLDEGIVYSGFGVDAEPVTEHFAKYYAYVKKPMMITEWSFPALDAGLPSVHGAGQRFLTQTGRTAATELFARTMLSLPFLIGYDYFMWVDEPALGISTPFPEDSNYGLVNGDNKPYPLLTGMFEKLHADLWTHRNAVAPKRRDDVQKCALSPMQSALKLKQQNPDAKDVAVTRDGDKFVVDNGRLTLEGSVGSSCFIDKISLDGTPYGSYNAMVYTSNKGSNPWRNIQRVTAVNCSMQSGCAVIEISGEYQQKSPFAVTHRIIVPPGSAKFICEVLQVRNIGDSDLSLMGLYCRFDVLGKNWDEAKAPPNLWGVPQYGCWIQEGTGAYYGALASLKYAGVKIYFWKDKTIKSFHPDALYTVEMDLKPGDIFRPANPVVVIGALGIGGKDGWMKEMKAGNALFGEG
jgi:hypothetical protein